MSMPRDAQAMCDELNQLLTTKDLGALIGDRVVMDVEAVGDEGLGQRRESNRLFSKLDLGRR